MSKPRWRASIRTTKIIGQAIEGWRKEIFENTIGEVYFWAVMVLGTGFGCSLIGCGWLRRERERRLAISADIVTQLFNSYIGSRAKSLELIAKYNGLVERYNRLHNETNQTQRTTGQTVRASNSTRA